MTYTGKWCQYGNQPMTTRGRNKARSESRDHIVPKAWGGPDLDSNIRRCCRQCNQDGIVALACSRAVAQSTGATTKSVLLYWHEYASARNSDKGYLRWICLIQAMRRSRRAGNTVIGSPAHGMGRSCRWCGSCSIPQLPMPRKTTRRSGAASRSPSVTALAAWKC